MLLDIKGGFKEWKQKYKCILEQKGLISVAFFSALGRRRAKRTLICDHFTKMRFSRLLGVVEQTWLRKTLFYNPLHTLKNKKL
jgi:hypothetical protein